MNDATVWPPFVVWSSVIEVSVGAMAASTGASLTAVTVIDAVSLAALNAVAPPAARVRLAAGACRWSGPRPGS